MQLTASNSRSSALTLHNGSDRAERLRLARHQGTDLPWAPHVLRAEELRREREKQSDLDIDNSSMSTVTAEVSSVSQAGDRCKLWAVLTQTMSKRPGSERRGGGKCVASLRKDKQGC